MRGRKLTNENRNNVGGMAAFSEGRNKPANEKAVLSRAQQKVIDLIADGKTRKEISGLLEISIHTVNTQLERTYRKLGVHNASEATAKAVREELFLCGAPENIKNR